MLVDLDITVQEEMLEQHVVQEHIRLHQMLLVQVLVVLVDLDVTVQEEMLEQHVVQEHIRLH